jgi:hypothetical protein
LNFAQDLSFIKNPAQKNLAEEMTKSAKTVTENTLKNIPNITDLSMENRVLHITITKED